MRELEQKLGGGIVEEVWSRWKEKAIAAVEKGIDRKKVTERSGGWWLENVERLIVIRKMTCRKLRIAWKRRVGEATLSQLWENYRRVRKEVKKAIV